MRTFARLRLAPVLLLALPSPWLSGQEATLELSGELMSDQRVLLREHQPWAWNETRLTTRLDKRTGGNAKFHGEIWLRNLGLPGLHSSADLYNKGIVDPLSLEIREAYVQLNGFLCRNLDVTLGRQRIAWGTADVINPTDNLNPADMEDVLDFGRRRGSDAIRLQYYLGRDVSLEAVLLPHFQAANLPVGIFAGSLSSAMELPTGMVLRSAADTLLTPAKTLAQQASGGLRLKGFVAGVDLSLSYVWSRDGLPFNTWNTLTPVDLLGGVGVASRLSYERFHVLGVDLATSLGGVGLWGEAALFLPDREVVMTNDLSAFYPLSPDPVLSDSVVLKKEACLKFVVGADYNFADGSYLNLQFIHGFAHERGREALNDYLFLGFNKALFDGKLTLSPVNGAFIVADWSDIGNNHALAYMPELSYQATPNAKLTISAVIFDGEGNNLFAGMKDLDMLVFSFACSL
ncbi:MAG: DUF1302 family protein [Bacteroidales bacterium]